MIFPDNNSNNINYFNMSNNSNLSSKQCFQNLSSTSTSTTSSQNNTVFPFNSPISNISYPLYIQTSDYYNFPKETQKRFKGKNFIPKSRLIIDPKVSQIQTCTQSFVQNSEQETTIEKPVTVNLMSQ